MGVSRVLETLPQEELAYSHWYPACASEPMAGDDSTATTTSVRAYQVCRDVSETVSVYY